MYHLLKRKLKKYYIKHPGKVERTTNTETIKESTETVKNCRGTTEEKENKNPIKKRPECTVATAVVCDFSDKEEKSQKEVKDSDSKKLEVPTRRNQLSSPSQENLSTSNGELSENPSSPKDDLDTAVFESETDGVEKDVTCCILSGAGIEISRKNSCNYSSVEVMAVKGRRLSLNLSHISVESKVTVGDEPLKNTSVKNLEETVENSEKESPRRSEAMPNIPQEKTSKSPRHSGCNAPSIGKVSLINSKVISIPLQQAKQDSPDKVITGNLLLFILQKFSRL